MASTDVDNTPNDVAQHTWTKYPSMFNETTVAVVTEKLDGSNAALARGTDPDSKEIMFFSRNQRLEPHTKFHGFQTMKNLRGEPLAILNLPLGSVVYGEVYGGFDGKVARNAVQKRIGYGLDVRFTVFDIMINGECVMYSTMCKICAELGLDVVKPVFEGTVVDALGFAVANVETFPSGYAANGDLAEGFVVRIDTLRLKHRRTTFREGMVLKSTARLANVKSKLPTDAPQAEVVKAYVEDLKQDSVVVGKAEQGDVEGFIGGGGE